MSPRARTWLAWLPALAWAALIFLLSAQPALPSPPGVDDKLAHAITYGVLGAACLVGVTTADWRRVSGRPVLAALLMAVAYGASDELHQAFVPGRTPDAFDLLADATGAATAVAAAWLSAILLRRCLPVSRF